MELSSWVRRVSQGLVSWNSAPKKLPQNSKFPDLCIVINHSQVVVTASNPDPDPLWPWWPRFPWPSGGRSGAATTAPRSRQNSVGGTVPAKNAGLDWWDRWVFGQPVKGWVVAQIWRKFLWHKKKSILSIHTKTIPMILSKSHKQRFKVSTVNVTSLILIRGNLATIELFSGGQTCAIKSVLLSLLSKKENSSWWFDTWYYDWDGRTIPPKPTTKSAKTERQWQNLQGAVAHTAPCVHAAKPFATWASQVANATNHGQTRP